jgi:5-methylcytosine-specific restriction endonuclease McrA
MAKRFKPGICAYCGAPVNTADHVFARSFFPETLRADLPQVVACAPCNAEPLPVFEPGSPLR